MPERQPAETLRLHVDEPIANKHFDIITDLDYTVAEQCRRPATDTDRIKGQYSFIGGQNQKLRRGQPKIILNKSLEHNPTGAKRSIKIMLQHKEPGRADLIESDRTTLCDTSPKIGIDFGSLDSVDSATEASFVRPFGRTAL